MTALFELKLGRWRVASLDVHLELGDDQRPARPALPGPPRRRPVTQLVKGLSNWWTREMTA